MRSRKGGRSAFRDEFYRDNRPSGKLKASTAQAAAEARRRKRRKSILVPLIGLFFLLCVIAVAGSSAMIWLRKLGAFFGVEWSGDF